MFVLTRERIHPLNLTPGSRLGPHEVVGALGSGGMGERVAELTPLESVPARDHTVVIVLNFVDELRRRLGK